MHVHDITHLPWWAVIPLTSITLRAGVTTPLFIVQQRLIARAELLRPLLLEWKDAIKENVTVKSRKANLSVEQANKELMKQVNEYATLESIG